MAGAITHLLIAEEALKRSEKEIPELYEIIKDAKPFLLLGSVSPDLPYASNQKIWADRMHYRWTNEIPIRCAIGCSSTIGNPARKEKIAWIAGYIAHCVADATIHPIVQKIVGPYHASPERHRQCEMTQDSILYSDVKGQDLRNAHFVEQIKNCGTEGCIRDVLDYWTNGIRILFAHEGKSKLDPERWYSAYSLFMNAATDADILFSISRMDKKFKKYVYYSTDDIEKQDAELFYYNAELPSKDISTGSFKEHGYLRAINNIMPRLEAMLYDINNAKDIFQNAKASKLREILRNWDLDTGADMDMPDTRVTFWT